jgi:hypothetical protein
MFCSGLTVRGAEEIADTRAGDAGLGPSLRVKADRRRENGVHA